MFLFVIGTRPEAIKMCPLILKFKQKGLKYKLLLTGQHTSLVENVLKIFDIIPDFNLNIMKQSQSLNYIISSIIKTMDEILTSNIFEYVLVHGDTTTAMAAALCAFSNKIKIIHIEAGLRTSDINDPFPEEANRRIISVLANISFAPTKGNYDNLVIENNKSCKYVVGNTVIDAVKYICDKYTLPNKIVPRPFILLTTHRRENLEYLPNIFKAVDTISKKYKIDVIFPMHPNPKIKQVFDATVVDNQYISVLEPQNYIEFCNLMMQCEIIVTDSGGILEESSYFKKPVLILRHDIERKEILSIGNATLVGTNTNDIQNALSSFFNNEHKNSLHTNSKPFGSGDTCEKICEIIINKLL